MVVHPAPGWCVFLARVMVTAARQSPEPRHSKSFDLVGATFHEFNLDHAST